MRILVDMDGVLADFERGFLDDWRARFPERAFMPIEERNVFYVQKQYTESYGEAYGADTWAIMTTPGYFRRLPPILGGADALNAMRDEGIDVWLCTSPLHEMPTCATEKFEWVVEHLGAWWTGRMIIARDKTLIRGDILIDDRPALAGVEEPLWEHVLYDQPYNRAVTDKRRITWDDWRVLFTD